MKYNFKIKSTIFSSLMLVSTTLALDYDTTKVYKAHEIVVTATRSKILSADSPASVQIISNEKIKQASGNSVADVMKNTSGVVVQDYGTTSSVKSISLRGLSSANTTIMLDGNIINDSQNGFVDLSLLPLDAIERIEVLSGSASSLYGGNAAGGVVNIISKTANTDKNFGVNVKTDIGSFGLYRISSTIQSALNGLNILSGISYESGKENYPFSTKRNNLPDTIQLRNNADYIRKQAVIIGKYILNEDISVNSTFQYTQLKQGVPGNVSYPSNAKQQDDVYRTIIGLNANIFNNLSFTASGIYNYTDQVYNDSLYVFPTYLIYKNRSYMINAQMEYQPTSYLKTIAGIEYGEAKLTVDGISYGYPLCFTPYRTQKSAFLSNEIKIENENNYFDQLNLYFTIRYDGYNDVKEEAVSPKIGFNIRAIKDLNLHVRGSIGKNFRVPTFNDLYYPGYSNPMLNPEKSNSFELGIMANPDANMNHTVDLSYFNIDTENKIVMDMFYIPKNIGKANNSGIEFRYNYESEIISANVGFAYNDAREKNKSSETDLTYNKQLTFVPKFTSNVGVSVKSELGTISINYLYVDKRFTTADNKNTVKDYGITNIKIIKEYKMQYFNSVLQVGVQNIFDVNYQVFSGYPLPGRSFTISLGIEY